MANQEYPEEKFEAGHPMHPALVHFPITLFPLSSIFLVLWIWLANPFFLHAAYWLFLLGALVILPVVLTGLRDWRHTEIRSEQGRKITYAHITLGVVIAFLSLASGIFYLTNKPYLDDALIPGFIVISFLVSLIVLTQGFLGGLMVYTHHMGTTGHMR